jgi:pyruvate,orthophosphate dikinase
MDNLSKLEKTLDKKLGDNENPLLLSVRSGAVISMPGMMDTILNLGLNDIAVEALSKKTNNERFAYDSYRRFIQMFSDVVMGIQKYKFERILDNVKESKGYKHHTELTVDDLTEIVKAFTNIYTKELRQEFPDNPKEQLILAVKAVFDSWNNPRADVYRKLNDIPHNLGTAVNIQSMVFGNMGKTSGTGVAFTRNPSTGENILFGEYLVDAQGEDVVAGIRTPEPIASLKNIMPDIYNKFENITEILENHYKDMQDIEFTIENENLYILQTRNGKRTAKAAINIAAFTKGGDVGDDRSTMNLETVSLLPTVLTI